MAFFSPTVSYNFILVQFQGEFETGFERGGQTREHAMLVKTAGVKHLVILVNKMDDPTVKWSEERYNYCKENLTPYLKKVGFNPAKDIQGRSLVGLRFAFSLCGQNQKPNTK